LMRVWVVATVSKQFPGGMRRHMELHAQGMSELGHTATAIFAEDMKAHGPSPIIRRVPGVRSLSSLLSRYREERPDVINVHSAAAPAWIWAKRAGVVKSRIVVMSYSADDSHLELRAPRDALRWALNALPSRAAFPRADGIWCVNQQDVEWYVSVHGVERARLARFPHAVADSFYRNDDQIARNPKQLLFVGTWLWRKGSDVLRAAFDRIVESEPDVSIVLAGTMVGEAAVRASLSDAVNRRTRVIDVLGDEELRQLYRSSSLLLLPSRWEGLPISMLEGFACGCPPLTAANSGMLDVIEPGVNGWLEVSFDPSRWAVRVLELLSKPEALLVASNGAEITARSFRLGRVATDVAAWYSQLIDA
jgi:glycosyltransferase involved in cell wall biosynthesis